MKRHAARRCMCGYLRTVLGCHQVFAFEDVEEKLLRLAALFGLDVL